MASWLLGLAIPLLAVAFLVGVWRWRLFIAEAMQRLAMRLQGRFRPPELRRALAEEFDDPTLEFVHRAGDHWVDVAGEEIPAPEATAEQALTEVFDGGERVAAILHDPALSEDAAFTATATAYALMTLESERLAAQTDRLLSEVREARMRARSAAEEERRRIEHDLHDGAQQRLIALGIKLELAAERTAALDPGAANLMRGLGAEVDQALDEVRALARGDLPAELGLGDALRTAARSSALPVTVLEIAVRRYPPRDRDRGLLLLSRGAAERVQARTQRDRRRCRARRRRPRADAGGARRRRRLRRARGERGDRAGEHAREDRGRRRPGFDPFPAGRWNARAGAHPDRVTPCWSGSPGFIRAG